MKSRTHKLIFALVFLTLFQYSFAQQKGVDDLVTQFQNLLHPPSDQAKNSLAYTQHYLDLRKKVAGLRPEKKAEFETGISKFASDSGYTALHTMLIAEAAQYAADSTQVATGGSANAGANLVKIDTTVQMQVFDKKHKLLGTTQIKPADLENKMKKDGYQISAANYDFTTRSAVLTLTRSDGSGTTARVTFPSTGDMDGKYKLTDGRSLTVHSATDGTTSVKVTAATKSAKKK